MTQPQPKKPKANSYEDADFLQVLQEIEEADDEIETISATARGKISGVKTRQKNRIKIAKAELGIPTDVLKAVLKQRKLERQLAKISASIPDDEVELYTDAAGQFSFLKPDAEHPQDNAAQVAARQRMAEQEEREAAEIEEGGQVLNEMMGGDE